MEIDIEKIINKYAIVTNDYYDNMAIGAIDKHLFAIAKEHPKFKYTIHFCSHLDCSGGYVVVDWCFPDDQCMSSYIFEVIN